MLCFSIKDFFSLNALGLLCFYWQNQKVLKNFDFIFDD